jgi:hypothetical protein
VIRIGRDHPWVSRAEPENSHQMPCESAPDHHAGLFLSRRNGCAQPPTRRNEIKISPKSRRRSSLFGLIQKASYEPR